MKRLYFLVPTIKSATSIVAELRTAGIAEDDIYLVGKDHYSLAMANLREAGILQTTDIFYALQRGLIIGALAGIIAGIVAYFILPNLGLGIIFGIALLGAGFGAWGSSLVGISIPNRVVAAFESDINAGKILMLVDVPLEREAELTRQIKKHHPTAIIEGIEFKERKKRKGNKP